MGGDGGNVINIVYNNSLNATLCYAANNPIYSVFFYKFRDSSRMSDIYCVIFWQSRTLLFWISQHFTTLFA